MVFVSVEMADTGEVVKDVPIIYVMHTHFFNDPKHEKYGRSLGDFHPRKQFPVSRPLQAAGICMEETCSTPRCLLRLRPVPKRYAGPSALVREARRQV